VFRHANADDLEAVYQFIRKRDPDPYEGWSDAAARGHLGWYIASVLCGLVERDERIVSVVLGRPVRELCDGHADRYKVDWSGTILWVEGCYSESGMATPWNGAMEFFNHHGWMPRRVAWSRLGGSSDRVYQADAARLAKLIR
jgi:hypothetical protein